MSQTTHISPSGGLISTAFIENIRQPQTNQRGTQPDTFGLRLKGGEDAPKSPAVLEATIAETWEALLERWDAIATTLPDMDISQARDRWILPLLRALDFQPVYQRSDIVLDDSEALRFNVSHFGWESSNDERGTMNDEQKTHGSSFIIHRFSAPPPLHTVPPSADLDVRPAGAPGGRSAKGKAPHDMVQLFLNVSREHRWALLTNGLQLRLLRDYHHTYNKGYIEFDLESIFETRNFGDFRALYRMAHASRFIGPEQTFEVSETSQGSAAEIWEAVPLEMFYRDSQAAGIQVGADLQKQVREAIETLGNGFLASSYQHSAISDQPKADSQTLTADSYSLLQQLQQDAALCQQFYSELLHIVYRILFLLYAEQRGMVPQSGAPLDTLYRQSYSLTALRSKAESDATSPEAYDLWEGLKVTFDMFREGAAELGVYRYNGMLFAEDQTPLLDGLPSPSKGEGPGMGVSLRCRNHELLHAIRALTLIQREGVLQRISYADLNVEEIGGIYESLLDFAPRVTSGAEQVEGRDLPPNTFFLDPRGTARKTSGSYYTHPSLVNALVESALLPVLEERLAGVPGSKGAGSGGEMDSPLPPAPLLPTADQRQAAEQAILSLKVCDPAMGSGHFLIAANNALALRLAQVRTGEEYPAERHLRRAKRDVLSHCIYGVDLNPMAVELAKVSLWINAAVEDKPLSFLDHHLKVGNSLLGVTPELMEDGIPYDAFALGRSGDDREIAKELRKRNRQERRDVESGGGFQPSLFRVTLLETTEDMRAFFQIDRLAADQPQLAREQYAQYRTGQRQRRDKLLADFWTAAFFWPMPDPAACNHDGCGLHAADGELLAPTYGEFLRLRDDGPETLPPDMLARVQQLAEEHRFFHWHLEFPDVFRNSGEKRGSGLGIRDSGKDINPDPRSPTPEPPTPNHQPRTPNPENHGFDVILGNPPWERIKLQEKEFFSDKAPAIANASNAAARRRLIKKLPQTDPALHAAYLHAMRTSEAQSDFLHSSGRYPLTGRGDVNTYQVFAELARELPHQRGRAGVIVPTGIATDYTNRDFFADLVDSGQLASLFDFENRRKLFPEVDSRMKFALLTLRGPVADPTAAPADFAFFLLDTDELGDPEKTFTLTAADFARLNPNTKTCPIFRSRTDADLTRKLYAAAPVLHNEETGKNPWGVSFSTMFHMTNDSGLFRTREQLQAEGFTLHGNRFVRGDEVYLPLYEAKMFWHFDHRFGSYEGVDSRSSTHLLSPSLTQYASPNFLTHPWYWVNSEKVKKRVTNRPGWLLAFRDITNSTNERTAIFSLLPFSAMGNNAPIFIFSEPDAAKICGLTANFSAMPFDFAARKKVGGTHMNFFILEQLPVIPPDRYTPALLATIVPRVLELTYTAWDLRAFADDVWREAGEQGAGVQGDKTSALQQAILQQWAANRDATGGGHEGATPPVWAEAQGSRGAGDDEPIHHSQFTIHHSPFPHPPFMWDETRRAQLRADLDGLYGHLYGLSRDELAYILDTFPIVRRKDEAQYGEYRTKRLVLAAYDRVEELEILKREA